MSDKDIIPQIIMMPEVQAELDAAIAKDPGLGKALAGMKESILNAMQGVTDGRYKSFDEAMEAMTGHRPERVKGYEPKHGLYHAMKERDEGDGFMCVISDGNPHLGHDPVIVLDVNLLPTKKEAEAWADKRSTEILAFGVPDEDRDYISGLDDEDDDAN